MKCKDLLNGCLPNDTPDKTECQTVSVTNSACITGENIQKSLLREIHNICLMSQAKKKLTALGLLFK